MTSTSFIRLKTVAIAAAGAFLSSAGSGYSQPAPTTANAGLGAANVSCDSVVVRSTVWSTSGSLRASQAPAAHPVVVQQRALVNCKPSVVASAQDASLALR